MNQMQTEKSSFSPEDKTGFYKKKWLKEHTAAIVILGLCIAAVFIIGIITKKPLLSSAVPAVLILLAHAWRHNSMMAYVESKTYRRDNNL